MIPDEDIPDDNDDDTGLDDIFEFSDIIPEEIQDVIPGLGTIRRLWRLLKKHLSREYLEEIKRINKEKSIVLRGMNENVAMTQILREYISQLETKVENLEEKCRGLEEKCRKLQNPKT